MESALRIVLCMHSVALLSTAQYRSGDPGVVPPTVISKVEAVYSEDASEAGLSGSVFLSFVVDESGFPTNIRVTRSLGLGLDENAIAALRQWRFGPATKADRPIRFAGQVEITFRVLKPYSPEVAQQRLKLRQHRFADAEAMLQKGVAHQFGRGVTQDKRKAFDLYRSAAEKEHPAAMLALGSAYLDGIGSAPDPSLAARWISKAALYGLPSAEYALALLYQAGKGVPKNENEALRRLRVAADEGLLQAQLAIARELLSAPDADRQNEGRRYLEMAARRDYAPALHALGIYYLTDPHRHLPVAAAFFGRALKQKYRDSAYALAVLFESGRGVEVSPVEAAKLYQASAEEGLVAAQYRLGTYYKSGTGVIADPAQALFWLTLASNDGSREAAKEAATLRRQLTSALIAEVEQKAAAWRPKPPSWTEPQGLTGLRAVDINPERRPLCFIGGDCRYVPIPESQP
ncbi:MAG: TonB family protein [Fimbriimonadaceae bacterium]|nr:TonB family protein [Fimbriimonadaceae bacterium]